MIVSFIRPKRTDYLRGIDCFNEGREPEANASRPYLDGWNKRRAEAITYNAVHATMKELVSLQGRILDIGGEYCSIRTGRLVSGVKPEREQVIVEKAEYPKAENKSVRHAAMDAMLSRFKAANRPMDALLSCNN